MIKIVDADVHLVITSDRDAIVIVGGASVPLAKLDPSKVAMLSRLLESERKQMAAGKC